MEPINQGNPYAAPQSELDVAPQAVGGPASLENAVAGRYDFGIGEVMSEAWRLTKGFKGSFWAAGAVIFIIQIVAQKIVGTVFKTNTIWVNAILNGLVGVCMVPLSVGLQMMCIRRALGQPYSFATAFGYLPKARTLLVGALLVLVCTYVGLALLVIPGVYLGLAYMMTSPLIAEHNLPAWGAMETSRRALTHKWFRIFGLVMLVGLIVLVSAVGLLIPLIWTVPFGFLTLAVLYRRVFHSGAAVPAAAPSSPTRGAA
jgi:hypothetical protein